jgi:ribonuclease HI
MPSVTDITVFTDGSCTEEGVGASVVAWKGTDLSLPPDYSASYSLHKDCTVFQAEVYALLKCSEWILSSSFPATTAISIFSDSTAALNAITGSSNFSEIVFACRENFVQINSKNILTLGLGVDGLQKPKPVFGLRNKPV